MHDVAIDLLILLAGIWLVAVTLRPLGIPTVMGELIVGVLVGPAVLGLIEPSEAITLLAEIGIFFLMFHAGVETQPAEFWNALKRSLGVAIVGAAVPFAVSFGVALAFGFGPIAATFVGLTMTATAVVITLKSLKDLGLANTRVARVIVASCVIDDLLTLVFFGLIIGVLTGGTFEPISVAVTVAKVLGFFGISILIGRYVYPFLKLPFRSEGGKGFTFVLLSAVAMGLFAEAIGLHMILGAYLAGLFFEAKVAHPNLVKVVVDRAYGIAYSFLGPIFFMTLGFSVTFDISGSGLAFLGLLTTVVIVGQILSAGGMALRIGLSAREALTVGVGMCGRAELAFILASLALAQGAIDQAVFSVLIFTAFVLNLFTPMALKGCSVLLAGRVPRREGAIRGVVQLDKFQQPYSEERFEGVVPHTLPDLDDGVVIYRHGPEVDSLLEELDSRGLPTVVIEEDEATARRLQQAGRQVVLTRLAEQELDLGPLAHARGIVANGDDEHNAVLAVEAREQGFTGPIVAIARNPRHRAPMLIAGVTATLDPTQLLAAALAMRTSSQVGPRVAGPQALGRRFEIAELRVHGASPLAGSTLAEAAIPAKTGANIVGQWLEDGLRSPPAAGERLVANTILVAAGSRESIRRLRELSRPVSGHGPIVIAGFGGVGRTLADYLGDAGETVQVIDREEHPGVHFVGDVLDPKLLQQASVDTARAVVLAIADDGATLFAAKVVRDFAPEILITACVSLVDNVERIQRAGADFALSTSQVAGQLLMRHLLGETVSLQPRIKLVKVSPGPLTGKHPLAVRIRERTGCTVVAVERGEETVTTFDADFRLLEGDALYLCGTKNAVNRFYDRFDSSRL